jgi:hypothetical protein
MRLMILRMLTSTSLAAFSTGLVPTGQGNGRPVQPVRASNATAPGLTPTTLTAPQTTPATGDSGAVTPSRILPRGSLLDLAV